MCTSGWGVVLSFSGSWPYSVNLRSPGLATTETAYSLPTSKHSTQQHTSRREILLGWRPLCVHLPCTVTKAETASPLLSWQASITSYTDSTQSSSTYSTHKHEVLSWPQGLAGGPVYVILVLP